MLAPGTGKTSTGRLWTYVRDERPRGGVRPPAAVFFASPDRQGERPLAHLAAFCGVLVGRRLLPASTGCTRLPAPAGP